MSARDAVVRRASVGGAWTRAVRARVTAASAARSALRTLRTPSPCPWRARPAERDNHLSANRDYTRVTRLIYFVWIQLSFLTFKFST